MYLSAQTSPEWTSGNAKKMDEKCRLVQWLDCLSP